MRKSPRQIALVAWVMSLSTTGLVAQLHPKPTRESIINRLDPRFDNLVPAGTSLERSRTITAGPKVRSGSRRVGICSSPTW